MKQIVGLREMASLCEYSTAYELEPEPESVNCCCLFCFVFIFNSRHTRHKFNTVQPDNTHHRYNTSTFFLMFLF